MCVCVNYIIMFVDMSSFPESTLKLTKLRDPRREPVSTRPRIRPAPAQHVGISLKQVDKTQDSDKTLTKGKEGNNRP